MPAFNYIALDAEGHQKKGVLEGDNARQVRQQLREQGLTPLEVKEVRESGTKSTRSRTTIRFGKSVKVADLSLITRQLSTLLGAGLPLEEALKGVAEQTEKSHVKSILLGVRSRVLEGHTLANGMNQFPRAFPELYRATVAAGEHSGKLDLVLNRLAEYTEKQYQMRQKIRQALVYPSMMIVVSICIVTFLLIYVVPKMIGVFSQTGQQLPLSTVILVGISNSIKSYGWYFLAALVLLIIGLQRGLKQRAFRARWQLLWLRLPVLGRTTRVINSARFARTFGILFASGVPVLEAMTTAAYLITILPMRDAVEQAIARVREGTSISRALQQTGYFPPMAIHLIASGEASGQLEFMLEKASDQLESDVSGLIDNLLTLFEPIMILIMGGVVLFIVIAILLPIFNLDQFTG
ncbi:MAG: type II secretion system inner membrane protein GspF [Gammaproteobacteria bacterium]